MFKQVCIFHLITTFCSSGLFGQRISLTPTQASVDINKEFTFTCTYIGYILVIGTQWNVENRYTPSVKKNNDGTCSGGGIFADSSIFRVGCPSDTSFSVTILRVQLEDHDVQWSCFDHDRESNIVSLFVKVPVRNVTLNGPSLSLIKEHSRQVFSCNTSLARPQPSVSWFLYEFKNNRTHLLNVNSSKTISSGGNGLVAVESSLFLHPNKSINRWMLNCKGWTDNETLAVQSNKLTLDIMYPPENAPVIFGLRNGVNYTLIEYEDGILSCSSHDGNPLPSLTWHCYNHKPPTITVEDKNVTSTVTWKGLRGQLPCSCKSNHSWSGTIQVTSAVIDVLYPPNKPTFSVSGTEVKDVINVILNNTVQVKCESISNPSPFYSWKGSLDQAIMVQTLTKTVTDTKPRTFKCIASNQMYKSNNTYKNGRNESSITIQAIYPSTILPLESINILEGSYLHITCQVQKGNPTTESIAWTRKSDSSEWKSNQMIITNVSRADDTNYTCTLRSTIKPTIGSETLKVTNRSFHLNVFFPSEIKMFTLKDSESKDTFIVNITEKVSLECTAEANPASTLYISNPQGNIVSIIKETNALHYTITNASFKNAGKYRCEGKNNYTIGKPSASELTMIVRNPPRPSPSITFDNKVVAAQNTDTILHFVAHEYLDEDNKTRFTWFKQKTPLTQGSGFEMHSTGLNSSLIIRNISQSDFGEYSVKVSNTVGEYIHYYYVQAEVKVTTPVSNSSDKAGILAGSISGVAAVLIIVSIFIAAVLFKKRSERNRRSVYQNTLGLGLTSGSKSETELPNSYEALGNIPKDSNHYSELEHVHRRPDDYNINGISGADSESLKIDHEKAIYVNMKI